MKNPCVEICPKPGIGKALKNGYRDKVHFVTKLPMHIVGKPEDFDGYLERQLKRLQDDSIDIYLFHASTNSLFEKVKKFGLSLKALLNR